MFTGGAIWILTHGHLTTCPRYLLGGFRGRIGRFPKPLLLQVARLMAAPQALRPELEVGLPRMFGLGWGRVGQPLQGLV